LISDDILADATGRVGLAENGTDVILSLETEVLPKRIGQKIPQLDCTRLG
jgi:hypothetical protein